MADEIKTKTKTVINQYDYRLYFGKDIENPTEGVAEIPPLNARQNVFFTIGEKKYSIVLSGLKFTRKVYQPGLIEAEVTIIPVNDSDGIPSFEDVNDVFIRRQVELTITDTSDAKAVETTIAKNYFVYLLNPQITPTQMYVKLTIHSYDKLMAIDKYCKAFTTKKLCSDILRKEFAGFGLSNDMLLADIGNLRNLTYKDGDKQTEMIQPYLVQYNESFYDFMVRTANRCGEFFYFENGQLTLGLPKSEAEKLDTYTNVTMQGYTDGPVEVDYYSRDSVKDNADIELLNADPIATDGAGYPKDAFLQQPQYNIPVAGDEYIFPLEHDKYTSLERDLALRKGEAGTTMALKIFGHMVSLTDDPVNGCLQLGAKIAAEATNTHIITSASTEKSLKKIDDKWKSKTEQYNDKRLVAFSSLNSDGWIDHHFYGDIRKLEEKQHKKIICIDMGTNYVPVMLGEQLQVKGLKGNYIVIQVNLIANIMWQHDYRKIDPSDSSSDLYSEKQSQLIWAIPTDDDTAVPPVAPVPMYRKAGPQTAFVVDNDDKKYQGRVRIAYPWQSPNDKKRQELYTASESLLSARQKEAEANEKLADIKAMLKNLQLIKEELEPLKGCTGDELLEKRTALENEKQEKDLKLRTLEYTNPNDPNPKKKKTIKPDDYDTIQELKDRIAYIDLMLKYIDQDHPSIDNTITDLTKTETTIAAEQKAAEDDVEEATTEVEAKEKTVEEKANNWNEELGGMSTPWVRVAMPLATKGGGAYFMPSKGDEVLVNYDSDNIERPYVVGSVFSKNLVAPSWDQDRHIRNFLQKKSTMTLMSPNGQHISFVAPKDGWKFVQGFSPSLKTLQTLAPMTKGDDKDKILQGDEKDLNGGIYIGDRYGMYELSLSSHDRKIKILSPFGNVEIGAFTGITISAPNGDISIKGKNVSIEAGNKVTVKSGTNVKKKKSWAEWGNELLTNTTSSYLDSTFLNLLKPADLGMLRCVIEIFLRPIDGTLLLKSKNYVMLEAGEGEVQVPLDRYSKLFQKRYEMATDLEDQKVYGKIAAYIKLICSTIDKFQKEYFDLKKNAINKRKAYLNALSQCMEKANVPNVVTPSFSIIGDGNFVEIQADVDNATLQEAINSITENNLILEGENYRVDGRVFHTVDEVRACIKPIAEAYGKAIVDLHKKVLCWGQIFNELDNAQNNVQNNEQNNEQNNAQNNAQYAFVRKINNEVLHEDRDRSTGWIDDNFILVFFKGENNNNIIDKAINAWKQRYGDAAPTEHFMNPKDDNNKDDPFYDALFIKRRAIATFLLKIRNDSHNTELPDSPAAGFMPHNRYFDVCYTQDNADDKAFLKSKWNYVSQLKKNKPLFSRSTWDVFEYLGKLTGLTKIKKYYPDNNPFPLLHLENAVWNDKNGQILFSSEKGATYEFKKGAIEKLNQISSNTKDTIRNLIKSIK